MATNGGGYLISNKIIEIYYFNYRISLLIFLHEEMLDIIHSSHLGIVKCKSRAREVLFWPCMNSDIEEKISKCATCALHQPQNPKEQLIPSEIPDRPWSKIGVDLFEFKGQHYLISVDYFSKWPEVSKLENLSAKCVIQHMKELLSSRGQIDVLVSDNGPQLANAQMRQFAKDYGFTHVHCNIFTRISIK